MMITEGGKKKRKEKKNDTPDSAHSSKIYKCTNISRHAVG